MKRALYLFSILLVIGWGAAVFVFGARAIVHLMLIVAAISGMQALMICPKPEPDRHSV